MPEEYEEDIFYEWAKLYCSYSKISCNILPYLKCKTDEPCQYNTESECYKQFKEYLGKVEI